MRSIVNAFKELSASDKLQISWTLSLVLFALVIILYAIAASRGEDVDYFKYRLTLQEQRLNNVDQKVNRLGQTQTDQQEMIRELQRAEEVQFKMLEENQRWIEYWKTLPQLPKPQGRR